MTRDVWIDARVAAAGPVAGKPGRVRLTISLMPTGKTPGGVAVDVAQWPSWARQWQGRKLKLFVKPIEMAARPTAPTINDRDPALEHEVSFPSPEPGGKGGVMQLWEEVAAAAVRRSNGAAGDVDAFWTVLANVFTEPVGTPPYVNGAQLPKVLATGRGDAAILHLLAKVERLAGRVREPHTPRTTAQDHEQVPQPVDSWESEKKAGKVSFDIEDDSNDNIKDNLKNIQAALQAAKDKEQGKVEDAIQRLMKDNETQLAAVLELVKNDQLPTDGSVVTSPSLTGYPINALFGDRGEPLQQTQTLHLAALLPDHPDNKKRPAGALPVERARDLAHETTPPTQAVGDGLADGMTYAARAFVAAIRNSPLLARLFRFVVDVELDAAQLWSGPYDTPADGGDAYKFFLLGVGEAADAERLDPDRLMFSVAKATRTGGGKSLTGFWPATREELDLRQQRKDITYIRQTGAVSQIDGVVDLGQKDGEIGKPSFNPRFDVISIDPVLAMEASARNSRKQAAVEEDMRRQDPPLVSLRTAFPNQLESGVVSRGLSIVDRWRAESVAWEVVRSQQARERKLRIVDADDLTIGYRVDIAVRAGEDDPIAREDWRSLMEREIEYSRPGAASAVNGFETWFKELHPDLALRAPLRRHYDAGLTMPSARRRLLDQGEMIHAEEVIVAWEGDPLGLNCGEDTVVVRPGADVAVNRTFSLPSREVDDRYKAWPLRYGWAYRFGVRPVWLGGVSLTLDQAFVCYADATPGYHNVTLPRADEAGAIKIKGWRRFLRHEPVLAPLALLPEAIARETTSLSPQTGVRATLRTLGVAESPETRDFVKAHKDRETEETWRVILPPRVSLDETVRHGVFDGLPNIEAIAPGGLLEVDYDADIGQRGFGRLEAPAERTGQGAGFPSIVLPRPDTGPATEGVPPAAEDFFRVHPQPRSIRARGDAAHQYYVDPMADVLVVAVRPNNNMPGYGYFEGLPRRFTIREGERVHPLALTIKKDGRAPRTAQPTQDDFWDGKPGDNTGRITGARRAGGDLAVGMRARLATLHLRAGESVDVDCWFVPSVAKLRAYFAWPEVLAVRAAQDVGAPSGSEPTYRAKLLTRLKGLLGAEFADDAAFNKILTDCRGQPAWVGPGGVMADPAAVAAAAHILHEHMQRRPLPEISGVRTIDVVHAVAQPPRAPQFLADTAFTAVRTKSDDDSRLKTLNAAGGAFQRFGAKGDDGVIFVGKIQMDRDSCRQLEVRVFSTPPGAVIDDVKLGRTELQRLIGEWPWRVAPGRPGEVEPSQRARHLFGFDVDAEGKAYLPKRFSTLLLIDDLSERAHDSQFAQLETIDLVAEQIRTLERRPESPNAADVDLSKGAFRAAALDTYSDRLARRVTVVLSATSRFDPYFVRTAPTQVSPLPEKIFPPDTDDAHFITRQSFDGALDPDLEPPWPQPPKTTRSDYLKTVSEKLRHFWIPATIAPAKPAVHAVLPSYDIDRPPVAGTLDEDNFNLEKRTKRYWAFRRRPRLRILLDRPWFSSGEGERLGLVLWPPQLREIASSRPDADRLARGEAPRSVLHVYEAKDDNDVMRLADFQDEDLGDGGKFITRWGADPIRSSDGPTGPFLPREALLDVKPDSAAEPEDDQPGYVPSIMVPLQLLREIDKPDAPERAYETLTAALASYAPRFDIESEKWFVDVALNPDLVVEPFVRLGLVRYQAQALEALSVSAPTATWAQVPPARTVEIWASRNARGQLVLEVQVSGPASGRSRTDDSGKDRMVYPRMRISIVEPMAVAGGLTSERILPALDAGKDDPVPAVVWADCVPPAMAGSRDSPRPWGASFTLPTIPEAAPDRRTRLSVLVEEVEEFLSTADQTAGSTSLSPASSAPSPVLDVRSIAGDEVDGGTVRSGPRFLARVEIDV